MPPSYPLLPSRNDVVTKLSQKHARVLRETLERVATTLQEADSLPVEVPLVAGLPDAVRRDLLKRLEEAGWRTTWSESGGSLFVE